MFACVAASCFVASSLSISKRDGGPSVPRGNAERDFDIVLFGATGFTGRLAAQYMGNHAGIQRWALAGRNTSKVQALHSELNLSKSVAVESADLEDERSLEALARRSKVIITSSGPYSKYHGENLIRACIASGTHYADLSGEVFWQQQMVNDFHTAAKNASVKIVLAAGYDSVPSDLALALSIEALGGAPQSLAVMHTRQNGAMSGGTYASGVASFWDGMSKRVLGKTPANEDPYSLAPDTPSDVRVDKHITNVPWPRFDNTFQTHIEPSMMAPINAAIARRSMSLQFPNSHFSYSEGMSHAANQEAKDFLNRPGAAAVNMKPNPGEGPPEWVQRDGGFALSAKALGQNGQGVTVKIDGRGDPGYSATAKMLVETGIGLLDSKVARFGVLTPSTALGMELVQRLKAAEEGTFMHFETSTD